MNVKELIEPYLLSLKTEQPIEYQHAVIEILDLDPEEFNQTDLEKKRVEVLEKLKKHCATGKEKIPWATEKRISRELFLRF